MNRYERVRQARAELDALTAARLAGEPLPETPNFDAIFRQAERRSARRAKFWRDAEWGRNKRAAS